MTRAEASLTEICGIISQHASLLIGPKRGESHSSTLLDAEACSQAGMAKIALSRVQMNPWCLCMPHVGMHVVSELCMQRPATVQLIC